MYSTLPPKQRRYVLITLSLYWLLVAAGGSTSIVFEPNRITESMGEYTTNAWGTVVLISGLAAVVGVTFRRYRIEWIAAWMAAAGISPYVLAIWWLVADGEPFRLTQGFMMTALLVSFLKRAMSCSAHAAKMRELHKEVMILDLLPPRDADSPRDNG